MRKLLITALLLFTTILLQAQFRVGPRFGYNQSTTTRSQGGITVSEVYGFQGGVSMLIGGQMAFQPEILYMQKGMRIDTSKNASYVKFTNNYLAVPLLLNFSFGKQRVRFFFNFGPYVAYWLDGKVESMVDGRKIEYDYVFDENLDDDGIKDHRFDYGFCGGVGVRFQLGKGYIVVDGRLDYGFDDITTVKEGGASYISTRNRTVSGSIAYLFYF